MLLSTKMNENVVWPPKIRMRFLGSIVVREGRQMANDEVWDSMKLDWAGHLEVGDAGLIQ